MGYIVKAASKSGKLVRFAGSRNVGEAQDATVARVMSRFNKNVTFTPDAIEQIDARVKARKLVNFEEHATVLAGTFGLGFGR